MKEWLPNKATALSLVLLHFSMFHRDGGSYFALFALVPFVIGLERCRSTRETLKNAVYFQCVLAWECFQWLPTPMSHLWGKSLPESLFILVVLTPLTLVHVPIYAIVRRQLSASIRGPLLTAVVTSAIFVQMDFHLSYMGTTFGALLHQQAWLLTGARWGGVFFLTFLLFLCAEIAARSWIEARGWRRLACARPPLVFALLSLLVFELTGEPSGESKRLRIGVVQTNDSPKENLEHLTKAPAERPYVTVVRALESLRSLPPVDVAVLPESFVGTYFYSPDSDDARGIRDALVKLSRERGHDVVFGSTRESGGRRYNSVSWVSPTAELVSYDKRRPMPFGEVVPGSSLVPMLSKVFFEPYVTAFGSNEGLFRSLRAPLGILICNEIFYPDLARELKSSGAELLVHVGNETWLESAPLAHESLLASAKIRAVELGLPVVKVANYGYSGWIDQRGRVREVLPLALAEARVMETTSWEERTPYSKIPWATPVATAVVSLAGVGHAVASSRRRRRS